MKTNILKEFMPQFFISVKSYSKEKFASDLMAGLIVGIVALPLAIAFGIASGVTPEKGLFTAIIAGFIISFLGGNTVQIGGPTGAFIVIVYGIIQQYGIGGLAIATFLAGLMLVLMGVLKLGTVIKFIPYPIIVGFTSGIAVTIFSTQIKDLLGMDIDNIPSDFLAKWAVYFNHLNTIDWCTFAVGVVSILIIVGSAKITKKIPGSLIAIIVITIIAYILKSVFQIDGLETIGDRFTINAELPEIESLPITIESINLLFPSAFTIAILCAIESLLSAKVADGMTGARTNSNTELIAQGVANLTVPFFGGIPATGAIARTMTNINNGGRTPVAGMIHAVVLLLILLFLGDLTKHIPMACLAGVLVVVSYNMSEWRTFKDLLRGPKSDVAVLLTTFFLTVIFDLTIAIEIGLILAIFLFLKRIMDTTQVSVMKDKLILSEEPDSEGNEDGLTLKKGIEVYEIDGPFFFGIANKFDESMRIVGEKAKVRIIRMRKVPFMDSTGLHNLETLCIKSQKENIKVILSGVRPDVRMTLEKAGFYEIIGKDNICDNINIALAKANSFLDENNQ
ncbi:sulfate permease [Dysgonomonas sp. 216]|uniref:SulP family inorganic anion transporter n=1 Tax=Dysgonomonas sp. 216 TaxID=2302934 RepID=UPI0013D6FA17|nr:sulfate permease [Dysgonomonas sp. 216]NDW19308.1 sulfate permease [Dysgonomonas sp. 216]